MFKTLAIRIFASMEDAVGHVSRRAVAIALTILILMVAWLIVAVSAATGKIPDFRAPVIYDADSYIAEPSAICPGEPLVYTERYLKRDPDVRVAVYSSIVKSDGTPVRTDNVPFANYFIFPQDVGRVVTVSKVITAPLMGLPPDDYEWRIYSQAQGRLPSRYFVPFTVKRCSD